MKRLLFAALIGTATLVSFSSCKKEYVTNYLPGVSYTFDAPSDKINWKHIENTNSFILEVPFPELDDAYYNYGTVQIAIKTKAQPNQFEIIPAKIDEYSYSANYSVGKIRIYAENLTGDDVIYAPDQLSIKVTLTDADNGGN